jgi:hypothetical protein
MTIAPHILATPQSRVGTDCVVVVHGIASNVHATRKRRIDRRALHCFLTAL